MQLFVQWHNAEGYTVKHQVPCVAGYLPEVFHDFHSPDNQK
jgi:hypothetical protein